MCSSETGFRSRGFGSRGYKAGKIEEAILEFETAMQQNPVPQGSQLYRLGVAQMLAQEYDSAREALNRAAELGPDEIRKMAITVMQKLKAEGH